MDSSHIIGIFLRHLYVLRHSFFRLLTLFYWTILELLLWGFITIWLAGITEADFKPTLATALLGGMIFWHIFYRCQQAIAISFLEDVWTRNILNVFAAPIKAREFIAGLILISIADTIFAIALLAILAGILYAFDIWTFGLYIIPFFINVLAFGWVLGFVTIGLLIRFGQGVEALAWTFPAIFLPLSGVFYPISVLPVFLQKIAFFVPTSHLFEGMRLVLTSHVFPFNNVMWASALNLVFLVCSLAFFYWMLRSARKKGALSRMVTE